MNGIFTKFATILSFSLIAISAQASTEDRAKSSCPGGCVDKILPKVPQSKAPQIDIISDEAVVYYCYPKSAGGYLKVAVQKIDGVVKSVKPFKTPDCK